MIHLRGVFSCRSQFLSNSHRLTLSSSSSYCVVFVVVVVVDSVYALHTLNYVKLQKISETKISIYSQEIRLESRRKENTYCTQKRIDTHMRHTTLCTRHQHMSVRVCIDSRPHDVYWLQPYTTQHTWMYLYTFLWIYIIIKHLSCRSLVCYFASFFLTLFRIYLFFRLTGRCTHFVGLFCFNWRDDAVFVLLPPPLEM